MKKPPEATVTWEEICEEYPKLKELGEKYSDLKEVVFEIKGTRVGDKKYNCYLYNTTYREAYFKWGIGREKTMIFIKIQIM